MRDLPESLLSEKYCLFSTEIASASFKPQYGKVIDINGPVVKIAFHGIRLGQVCEIDRGQTKPPIRGRIISVESDTALLSPFELCTGLSAGMLVRSVNSELTVPVGEALLGRVLDGLGNPIDDLGALPDDMNQVRVRGAAPDAMTRPLIKEPFTTGLRAIDSAITMGCGQRIGIFGPPGTGKSSLLAAIAQHCSADVIVIGMIGERGREIREFLDRQLPPEKRENVVIVAATSDRTPMERLYGAHVATAIAEGFRDQGKSVMLLMDSLTRVARALREIGLAAGEAPTRRGYPASVYPALPELIERAGRNDLGDITAIYTVLVEGDGQADPIAEETRSLTDGHIVLSQEIADAGQYPAIDILKSLSRVMGDVVDEEHMSQARQMRMLMAKHKEIEVLLQVGEYQAGYDEATDQAVNTMPSIIKFLTQKTDQASEISETLTSLREILDETGY